MGFFGFDLRQDRRTEGPTVLPAKGAALVEVTVNRLHRAGPTGQSFLFTLFVEGERLARWAEHARFSRHLYQGCALRWKNRRAFSPSHVERHNLTIRTLMKRFTPLSLGFSKKLENLEAACAVFLAYYSFCWRTHDVVNQRTRLPAAMEAGVVDTLWSFEELFDRVMGRERAAAAQSFFSFVTLCRGWSADARGLILEASTVRGFGSSNL